MVFGRKTSLRREPRVSEHTRPFRHWIVDGVLPEEMLRAVDREWPTLQWRHWLNYGGEHALKLTSKDRSTIKPPALNALDELCKLPMSEMTGVRRIFPDYDFHGAGLHTMPRDGFLERHLDSNYHPQTGWFRRLSVVLFVNEHWEQSWGGELCLWDGESVGCRIEPTFNRMAVMDVTDRSYHSVSPVRCPQGEMRKTLSIFYWSLHGQNTKRRKSEFAPPVRRHHDLPEEGPDA